LLTVRDPDGVDLDTFPSSMGIITRLACGSAEREGIDVSALLRKAGLTQHQIDDPRTRIAVKAQIKFLALAANALKDDCLGFHLAQKFDLRIIGLLYYVLASSDTLDEALQRAARYSAIVNEGITLKFREGRNVGLSFEYAGVARHTDCHQIEFAMVALVRICRHLSNRDLPASRVSFTHLRKKDLTKFIAFFGCDVTFGATIDELAFSTSIKGVPIVGADPYLNDLLVQYCEESISHRKAKSTSFGLSVENVVARLLPHGNPHASAVARKLGISQRTLARRLASEKLTFVRLVQRLKFDLARRHLADKALSISEIAWLLGYRDVSAFTHAFKRWTGKAPRTVRQNARLITI
jgi:AraC-like DNA-binding protein